MIIIVISSEKLGRRWSSLYLIIWQHTVVRLFTAWIGKIDNFCLPISTNQERAPFVNLPTARLPIFPFSLKTLGLHIRPPLQIVIYNKHFTLKTVSISNKTYLHKWKIIPWIVLTWTHVYLWPFGDLVVR